MALLEKGNMPKKQQNIIIISGMVLLSLLLLWLMKSEQKQAEPYNFAIADTSNISKIFIADMTGNSISLDRIDNVWQINNTYKVQNRTMKVILRTIKDIKKRSRLLVRIFILILFKFDFILMIIRLAIFYWKDNIRILSIYWKVT